MEATIDGDAVEPTWNSLLQKIYELAIERMGFDAVKNISRANVRKGAVQGHGFFQFQVSGQTFSLQFNSANGGLHITRKLAQTLNVPVIVDFEWRNRADAQHPNRRGRLSFTPGPKAETQISVQ